MKWKISYLKFTVPIALLTLYIIGCKTEKNKVSENPSVADTTWALLPFVKVDSVNPILESGENTFRCPILKRDVRWEEKDVFNPAAIVRNNKVHLIFRAEDTIGKFAGTSRLGLAVSDDGLHFTKIKGTCIFSRQRQLETL
jgi:hypothetical protein